jgi:hypothetical protein
MMRSILTALQGRSDLLVARISKVRNALNIFRSLAQWGRVFDISSDGMEVTRLGPTHLKQFVNARAHVVQLEVWGLLRIDNLLRSPVQSYLFCAFI